jgi:hypothetical protein
MTSYDAASNTCQALCGGRKADEESQGERGAHHGGDDEVRAAEIRAA